MPQHTIFTLKQFGRRNSVLLNALYNLDIDIRRENARPDKESRFAEPSTGSLYFADVLSLQMYENHASDIVAAINAGSLLGHLIARGAPASTDNVKAGLVRMRKELMQDLHTRQTKRKEAASAYIRKRRRSK